MKKSSLTVGKPRKLSSKTTLSDSSSESRGRLAGGLFALGILAICTALVLPMRNKPVPDSSDAVAVMSIKDSEADEKEHLAEPDRIASSEADWSIFEYIGERIADLIRGE